MLSVFFARYGSGGPRSEHTTAFIRGREVTVSEGVGSPRMAFTSYNVTLIKCYSNYSKE